MNSEFVRAIAEDLFRIPSKILKQSTSAPNGSSNKELENVFEQIASVVKNNQSTVVSKLDQFSSSAAHALVAIFQRHPLFIDYLTLTGLATALVVVGSFASIRSIPYTALPPTQVHPSFDPSDYDLDHECQIIYADEKQKWTDKLDERQAIVLPLTSAVLLLALYVIITKLKVEWKIYLLKLLNFNIVLVTFPAGLLVYTYFANCFTRHLSRLGSWNPLMVSPRFRVTISDDNEAVNRAGWFVHNFQYREALTDDLGYEGVVDKIKNDPWERQLYSRELTNPSDVKSNRQFVNMYLNGSMLFSCILSAATTALYVCFPNDWLIRNMISMNLAVWAISQMDLKNLKSGVLVLVALFFYDVYFVFGTRVMVTVATSVDLPIKLSLPSRFNTVLNNFEFSILGLGDIILPGIFIALCYKYDIWRWHYVNTDTEFHLLNWHYIGRYFITALLSYIVALVSCMSALTLFGAAQPALLYIVPFLLISTLTMAWASGDLGQFWSFQYDTIELGENKLSNSDSEPLTTYSDYLRSDDLDNDDSEDYTNQDAIMDYESDNDDDDDSDNDCSQETIPEYKPTDLLRLLDDAAGSSDAEDADFVLQDDDDVSDSDTIVLDEEENELA
ncbi:hypothetical protein HG536_0A04120 [Torulaspora globosa]|uniref:Uncharacterized protein n=1 Tax=Torulaspora globosa TaxID=48254 RepID=A0A7G3ZAQ8_9SACH|nr:uncharacterized protein HG536_0A04120 [Torulaspora globosa]QLL30594.1 hypothetical protein HG536_0A04120 [Torulaspora globosa]